MNIDWNALNSEIESLRKSGKYDIAINKAKQAYQLAENELGRDNPDVAYCLNLLALIFQDNQQYDEADKYFKRAVIIYLCSFGADHPHTITCLYNHALLHLAQNNSQRVKPIFTQIVTVWEKSTRTDLRNDNNIIEFLANIYYYLGNYSQSEILYKRILEFREKIVGIDHIDIARYTCKLADVSFYLQRYEQAATFYKRSALIYEKQYGPEHQSVIDILNNLAECYVNLSMDQEAEIIYKRILELKEAILPSEHPDLITTLQHLEWVYGHLGQQAKAISYLKRVIAIYEQENNPNVLIISDLLGRLAMRYSLLGQYKIAEDTFEQALYPFRNEGPECTNKGFILIDMMVMYRKIGRLREAEKIEEQFVNANLLKNGVLVNGFKGRLSQFDELEPREQKTGKIVEVISNSDKPGKTEHDIETLFNELDAMIGLERVKKEIRQLIQFVRIQDLRQKKGLGKAELSLHSVFYGGPGTGKTTVARLYSKMLKALGLLSNGHLVETDRSGLVGVYIGETATVANNKVSEAIGGLLFIDEAYSLYKGENTQWDYGNEAIEILMKRMEDNRDNFAVIVAGYPEPMDKFLNSNEGFKSRFVNYIHFEDYVPDELTQIFQLFCTQNNYTLTADARDQAKKIIEDAYSKRDKSFGNARFCRNMFERIIRNQALRIGETIPEPTEDQLREIDVQDVMPLLNQ